MKSNANTFSEYLSDLPDERKQALTKLHKVIRSNLPKGFAETMSYGMPAFVVPHSKYPAGYHVDPKVPLPFLSFASQKNYIALYHMALYTDTNLLNWFEAEYPKHSSNKLDMGKSCVIFHNPKKIPFELIGELARKVTVDQWIQIYEKARNLSN